MYWCDSLNFFDLHCDTPYECYIKNQEFEKNTLAVSAVKGAIFNKWYQTFAIWIKDNAENPFLLYNNILNDFKVKLKDKPDNLTPLFALEGGAAIENEECLFKMREDGIKIITLTWNGENNIAGGFKTEKGLTDFGKKVIDIMNKTKIACDLSHLNIKSFYKVIERSDYPLATHSNCNKVFEHPRNLSDEQIRLMAQKGGIIGICAYPEFLSKEPFEGMYLNILHLLDLGFKNSIAIGTDFDGAKMDTRLDSIDKIPLLYAFLSERGLSKELLDKIFYENANNFIAKL